MGARTPGLYSWGTDGSPREPSGPEETPLAGKKATADDAPKSAYELAMARLRKKDEEAGIKERSVTEEQRTAIADVRRVYEAKLAEREILHASEMRRTEDPEARAKLEEEYLRDRERLASERDRKIGALREGGSPEVK